MAKKQKGHLIDLSKVEFVENEPVSIEGCFAELWFYTKFYVKFPDGKTEEFPLVWDKETKEPYFSHDGVDYAITTDNKIYVKGE